MFVFKDIDQTATVTEQNVVSYKHNFTTSSAGITSINIISGSVSQSYWNSLNVLFYASGSPRYPEEHKFGQPSSTLAYEQFRGRWNYDRVEHQGPQYLHKFHGYESSSIIQIPQQYIGEKIEEKSFVFVDKSHTDSNGKNPTIKDDGFGNLYSTNAHHSQSVSSISSSDNYIGNIFYEKGLAIITETGSWSGSVNYSDLSNKTNFTIELNSLDTVRTIEYSVTINPNEFNKSMNYSLRMPPSGSYENLGEFTSSIQSHGYMADEFTSSIWSPYITTINLYSQYDYDTPVAIARLPKPIKKSNKISTTFKIRLDL
tara:strand:+ start:2432 stop:3373 length:942 start_codon:yes stop_codon:yes gene_type:complete